VRAGRAHTRARAPLTAFPPPLSAGRTSAASVFPPAALRHFAPRYRITAPALVAAPLSRNSGVQRAAQPPAWAFSAAARRDPQRETAGFLGLPPAFLPPPRAPGASRDRDRACSTQHFPGRFLSRLRLRLRKAAVVCYATRALAPRVHKRNGPVRAPSPSPSPGGPACNADRRVPERVSAAIKRDPERRVTSVSS